MPNSIEREKNHELIEQIEQWRHTLHEIIDRRLDGIIQQISSGEPIVYEAPTLSLSTMPSIFKGKKAAAVVFPDGRELEVRTWRAAVTAIMQECNADPVMHERLMYLRGRVLGRQRAILAESPDGMDAPLRIDHDLYMEGKYDTESLIYVLTERVLDAVQYDYSGISIKCRFAQEQAPIGTNQLRETLGNAGMVFRDDTQEEIGTGPQMTMTM